ncbi:ABCAD protein, partial [Corythaeola cristata]|nr:ABCAD protein [Corythaeola cristata]
MCFLCIKMDLNEVEEMISRAENLYKQPYFWNLLHSVPRLESNSFYTEDGLVAVEQFLTVIQNRNDVNRWGFFVPGFQYNLSLEDVLWNPHAVRAELKSRFGFDDLHVEKLLSYTAQLTKV